MAACTAAAAAALVACNRWGPELEHHAGRRLGIGASPFTGDWAQGPWPSLVVLGLAGLGAVLVAPVAAERLRWRGLVLVAAIGQAAWTLVLAVPDGWSALTAQLESRYDYLAGVGQVGSPGGFLSGFTERIGRYPTHVRGHPPGTVLLLWALDRVGLGGSTVALGLCLLGGAVAAASVLVSVRSLAGEALARRSAPFVVLVPAGVVATNFDLLYTGLGAAALALFVLATEPFRRGRRSSWACALSGGVVFGLALLSSYGLALLAVPVVALAVWRRRADLFRRFAGAAVAVVALPWVWGFWWPSGLAATRAQYWQGLGRVRPGGPFAVLDLVAFAAVLGPVTLVALGRLRDRRLLPVVGGTAAAVLLALASQMSKGEVERIWQPFVPWLVVACGAWALSVERPGSWRRTRGLLAVQIGFAVVLAAELRSPW